MKWITREDAKVDRIACPWLIRKFVDPGAEFLFVPADSVGNGRKMITRAGSATRGGARGEGG